MPLTKADNPSTNDDALLKEVREFVEHAISADSDNRENAKADLRFEAGNQWPEQIKAQRDREGRPCLTFNRLPTYKRQVTNDQRQNKRGIKIHPVSDGACEKKAQIIQGIIRHIEYDSNADVARSTAVNSAASIGWGFWRLTTEYESPMSFNQVIRFKRERDALKVYFDPNSVEADGSDAKRCAIVWDMAKAEFDRAHPGVQIQTGNVNGFEVQPGWMDGRYVRMVEFYYFEQKQKTIYLLETGEVVDVLPEGVVAKAERKTTVPQLKWVKTAGGTKVLERTDIMCRWIPVFPVWGNEIDIEGKVVRSGIIRDAKDPAQMYNFWMTNATEEVSLRPKAPYIGAAGQFEGFEKQWGQANSKSFAYLEYNPVTVDGGAMAPPPQRAPMADVPVGMLQMAMHAADNIKAVTGLFDPSLGAVGNATSGVQEREQKRQGDNANFHYTDNLDRSNLQCGRCLLDMIPHYYDAQRVVQMLNEDGTIDSAEVNVPQMNPDTGIHEVLNDLTAGTYSVTISTGPSYQTQRQETSDSLLSIAKAWPKLLDIAGDKVIGTMDFVGSDVIAERLKKTIPANITQGEDGDDQGPAPLPPEVEQALQNAHQEVQQLEAQNMDLQKGIQKAQIDAASREEVARINAASAARVAEISGGAVLSREEIISMRSILDHHHRLQQQQVGADIASNAAEQAAGHASDASAQAAQQNADQSRLAASQAADQAQTTAEPD